MSNLIAFYGYSVSEKEIVSQSVGSPQYATPAVMGIALNHDYTDDYGDKVTVSIIAMTDNFTGTSHGLTNADIYQSLKDEVPVFYGDSGHAMILVDALFIPTPMGPMPVQAIVADPSPSMPPFRPLSIQELNGMYAATIDVQ